MKEAAKKPYSTENIQYVAPSVDFPTVYANKTTVSTTNVDASLIFGQTVAFEDGKELVVPAVKVMVSLSHLRLLRDLLVAKVED